MKGAMKQIMLLLTLLAARAAVYADGLDDWKRVASLNDSIGELRLLNNELVALGAKGIYRSADGTNWTTLPASAARRGRIDHFRQRHLLRRWRKAHRLVT